MASPETNFLIAAAVRSEAQIIEDALRGNGFLNITTVMNGKAAFNLIRFRPLYFIFAAWELPELSGPTLIQETRKNPRSAGLPCVLIVPQEKQDVLTRSPDLFVNGLLVRPLTQPAILDTVQDVLDKDETGRWPGLSEAEADRLLDEGRPEEALAQYQQTMLQGRTRMAGIHTEMGQAYLDLGRYSEAVEAFEEAIKYDQWLPRAQSGLGLAYLRLGRPNEAGKALEKALSLDPHNDRTYYYLGESLLQDEDHERAEKMFRNLLRRRPRDMHILNRLGISLRRQGKYDQALALYGKAHKLNDQDENLLYNLARCYLEAGQPDKATESIGRALTIKPDFEQARQLLAEIKKASP
ncbi:MAG: tetratricopeptide repeat protein [Proteobacteria bacterium]|nr:tetratricopeptide repeat protein [Pseudomonadota bacterium]